MNSLDYLRERKILEQQTRQDAINRYNNDLIAKKQHEKKLFNLFLIQTALFTAAAIPLLLFLASGIQGQ